MSEAPLRPPSPRRVLFTRLASALLLVVAVAVIGWTVNRVLVLEEETARLQQQATELQTRAAELDRQVHDAEGRAAVEATRAEQAEEAAAAADLRAQEAAALAEQETADREATQEAYLAAQAEARIARERANAAALTAQQAQQEAADARAEANRVRAERELEISRLQDALGAIADTQRTALGLVMNLGEDAINFEFDRADLKAADRELLARIAGVLLTTGGYRIQVFGHTDDVGTDEYNEDLSQRRARAVADYLIEAGLSPDIMTVRGYGKTRPLIAETTDAARARNRRVELGIIDTVVDFRALPPEEEQR